MRVGVFSALKFYFFDISKKFKLIVTGLINAFFTPNSQLFGKWAFSCHDKWIVFSMKRILKTNFNLSASQNLTILMVTASQLKVEKCCDSNSHREFHRCDLLMPRSRYSHITLPAVWKKILHCLLFERKYYITCCEKYSVNY